MTSAERGREGGTQILTVGGGGCVISIVTILTRGEGVKNPENLADVICERPLYRIALKKCTLFELPSILKLTNTGQLMYTHMTYKRLSVAIV